MPPGKTNKGELSCVRRAASNKFQTQLLQPSVLRFAHVFSLSLIACPCSYRKSHVTSHGRYSEARHCGKVTVARFSAPLHLPNIDSLGR